MANAVNALPITAQVEKCQDVSFPEPVKRLMIGQLRISIKIIKRIIKYVARFACNAFKLPCFLKGSNSPPLECSFFVYIRLSRYSTISLAFGGQPLIHLSNPEVHMPIPIPSCCLFLKF